VHRMQDRLHGQKTEDEAYRVRDFLAS
jgi:hypothetical protein